MSSPKRHVLISLLFILKCFSKFLVTIIIVIIIIIIIIIVIIIVIICKLVIILFHATHIFSRNNYIKKLTEVSLIMHIKTILVPKNLKKEPHSINRVMALSALNMLIALLHVQKDL